MNFLVKSLSKIILSISLLLLIYVFYKSEIYWNSSRRDYYFTYYIIASILLFFSFISIFFNRIIKEYLIIIVVSFFFGFYFFEIYLSFFNQSLHEKRYEKLFKKKWDKRTTFEIFNDLKNEGEKVTVATSPYYLLNKNYKKNLNILTLSGISNTKTIFCNENGYYSIYKSDRYGFNNPDHEWDKKEIDYLLVGDSFVHGACVNRPNDISSVLRTKYKKSVLNLGYGGNDSLLNYATLREYQNLNIKKVIWFFYEGNDLKEKTMMYYKKGILNEYIQDLKFSQNLKFRQNEINNFLEKEIAFMINEKNHEKKINIKTKIKHILKLSQIRSFFHSFQSIKYKPSYTEKYNSQKLEEFKQILTLTKKLVNEKNSKLYFVYLPEFERYVFNYKNPNYEFVKNIISELEIPFIDIHKEVFEKEQNPTNLFPFNKFGHYNSKGYKKVAEFVYKFTKD